MEYTVDRAARREEPNPLRQIERFIDAHLLNARGLGRLVFVLGGEAQRQESPLHARRMEVHDELVTLLEDAQPAPGIDPLRFRALFLALEGVTRATLEAGNEGRAVTLEALARAKRAMMRIAAAAVVGEGSGVPPLATVA